MRDNSLAPAPKRPRVIDPDVEQQDPREKLRRQKAEIMRLNEKTTYMEEELKKMVEEKKKMEAEKKDLKEQNKNMEKELRGLIECPVCLMAPREKGPVPVCSNGHIICRPCRDRIRQEAGEEVAKCPSCMVDLGNASSLIASRLVEKVKHECENEGCGELFNLPQLESHKKVCLFRKVLCPGNATQCQLEMPFNKVKEHVKVCPGMCEKNSSLRYPFHKDDFRDSDDIDIWSPTKIVVAHDKIFYLRHKLVENASHVFETVMLGSEEECSNYLASLTFRKPGQGNKVFTKLASQPRPIDLQQDFGDAEVVLPGKVASKLMATEEKVEEEGWSVLEFTITIEQIE